jgi:hypothetical protein
MPNIDKNTATLWGQNMINVYALGELSGLPSLYRWGKAIWTGLPYPVIEKEYYTPLYKQMQNIGLVPPDYILQNMSEEDKKKLQAMGVPTSVEDVAGQVGGRSLVFSMAAVPGLAGASPQLLKQLAVEAALGFGIPGTMAAATRVVQGYPQEALPAFFDVGLSSTILMDAASILKGLATNITPDRFNVIRQQVLQKRGASPWRDPEGGAFVKQIEDAILSLKRGDTSKYDALVKQFEEWQKTINEFNKLYELRQKGQLSPEDEWRYTKLLQEVAKIRDKYDILKSYIDTARGMGLEARGRQLEFESRTAADLVRASQEMPPGPVRDIFKTLQEMDYERLWRIVNNLAARANLAKRLGIDEQTLLEQATTFLKQRQWEKLSQFSPDELKRILTDRDLLKKYSSEFGMSEDDLIIKVEEILQQRNGAAPPTEQPKPPETQPTLPELPKSDVRPPIRRTPGREAQFRPPETEVTTQGGQVLTVEPKERPTVRRLDTLPDVETRLKILRRRLRIDEDVDVSDRIRDGEVETDKNDVKQTDRSVSTQTDRSGDTQTNKVGDRQTDKQTDKGGTNQTDRQTTDTTTTQTSNATSTATTTSTIINERNIVQFIPYLPPTLLMMPVSMALPVVSQIISNVVGAPVTLRLPPPPSGGMPLGAYLRSILPRGGLGGAQREVYVLL